MRRLYQALLHLYPPQYRERFGDEMLDVFLAAAERHRTSGLVAYSTFFLREIAGLLHGSLKVTLTDWRMSMKSKYWILGFGVAGLVVASVVTFGWTNYTSQATIRVFSSGVPAKYVPANIDTQIKERVLSMRDQVLSRSVLQRMIETHNLYPSERKTTSMEQLILRMRNDIDVEYRDNAIFVAFSYEDPRIAQRVARHVMTEFMDENVRESSSQAMLTMQFLTEQEEAATRELALMEQALANTKRGPESDRLAKEVERQRQRATDVRKRFATAKAAPADRVGQNLEVQMMPTLPEFWSRDRAAVLAGGLLVGLLAGALFHIYRRAAMSRTASSS